MLRNILCAAGALGLAACGEDAARDAAEGDPAPPVQVVEPDPSDDTAPELDALAEIFVKLGLALGVHDPDYVDAYQGPETWAEAAKDAERPVDEVFADARRLAADLDVVEVGAEEQARLDMLKKNVRAMIVRLRLASGEEIAFDEEARLVYDAVPPEYDLAEFDATLQKIDALLPGDAPLHERVEAFRNSLAVPEENLEAVFDAAIAECRKRTLDRLELPESESFTIDYVTDKPWSGYNWYQGDYVSDIKVNTDFPIIIDRAVDLGCHEGYPGHHTWNVFIERDLLGTRGWIEYAIRPLFSPQGLIAEGSGNYGIELAFPGPEKTAFERDVLFPLADLPPEKAATLEELNELRRELSHAGNAVARRYLDGEIDRETAIELQQKYALTSRERAEQRIRFVDTYRAYVINYNLGRDIVADWVERGGADEETRWRRFGELLRTPMSASDVQ